MQTCFPSPNSKRATIDKQQLITLLHNVSLEQPGQLLTQLQQTMEPLDVITNEHHGLCAFMDKLWYHYCSHNNLAPSINQQLTLLLPPLTETLLHSPSWVWQRNHPLQQLLTLSQRYCIGWQEQSGKASERFIKQLSQAVQQLLNDWHKGTFNTSNNALLSFFKQHQQRLVKLENRLKDSESGALHAKRCHQLSVQIINEKMQGKQLPAPISQFLQSSWHDSVVLLLIHADHLSTELQRLRKLTDTFIWSFQPLNTDDSINQQRLYRLIPQLQQEMQSAIISLKHEPHKLEHCLTVIEEQHLKILKGEALEYAPFALIDNETPLHSAATHISRTLLAQVNHLAEGQWLINDQQRIKLTLKLTDSQQLLFTDHNGLKAGQYHFEEAAYKLASSSFSLLNDDYTLADSANTLINNLYQFQQKKQVLVAERQAAEQRQQQQRHEQARRKALQEAKALELRKLEQRQLEQQQREQQHQQLEQQSKLAASTRQAAIVGYEKQLKRFQTGGTIRFYNNDNESRLCKLAAKTQQSAKFIFINRIGIKDCEILHDELIELLITGRAKIISEGNDFDDVLSKVVNNLRNAK